VTVTKLTNANKLKIWEKLTIQIGEGKNAGTYITRIEDFNNNKLVVSSPQYMRGKTLLRDNIDVIVMVTREDAIYQFHSHINQADKPGSLCLLSPPKSVKRVQRRQFCRIKMTTALSYVQIDDEFDFQKYRNKIEWISSITVDISAGGFLIKSPEKLNVKEHILIKPTLFSEIGLPTYAIANCCRTFEERDAFYSGIELILKDDLRKIFKPAQLKRLPKEILNFHDQAQETLSQHVFNLQIEFRKKGVLGDG